MSRDPRPAVIARRLAGVRRIIAVTGGKGGIGKTLVSSCLALSLARAGRRAGLLDLDLTGPCAHLVLGLEGTVPEELNGLLPVARHGLHFMSLACLAAEDPAPLRGEDVTNALIELLAIVQWGELDYLVIDMPPGLSDALLDAVRILRRGEFLVVATASQLVVRTVQRTLRLLAQVQAPVLGVVQNMAAAPTPQVTALAADAGLQLWGCIPVDPDLEAAYGHPEALAATAACQAVADLARRHLLA